MRKALIAPALIAVFAATPGTALGDNTEIAILEAEPGSNSNELIIVGELISSAKCEKRRPVELVVKLSNGEKIVDSGNSSKRGAFALVLRKQDTEGAEKFLVRVEQSRAGETTCKGAKEPFEI
jgi:hypothetical protein